VVNLLSKAVSGLNSEVCLLVSLTSGQTITIGNRLAGNDSYQE
jgi:hypothetical protein